MSRKRLTLFIYYFLLNVCKTGTIVRVRIRRIVIRIRIRNAAIRVRVVVRPEHHTGAGENLPVFQLTGTDAGLPL